MMTSEGADDGEIIVRPSRDGRWRVEIPKKSGAFVTVVGDQLQALTIANQMLPQAQVRILPAEESEHVFLDGLSATEQSSGDGSEQNP